MSLRSKPPSRRLERNTPFFKAFYPSRPGEIWPPGSFFPAFPRSGIVYRNFWSWSIFPSYWTFSPIRSIPPRRPLLFGLAAIRQYLHFPFQRPTARFPLSPLPPSLKGWYPTPTPCQRTWSSGLISENSVSPSDTNTPFLPRDRLLCFLNPARYLRCDWRHCSRNPSPIEKANLPFISKGKSLFSVFTTQEPNRFSLWKNQSPSLFPPSRPPFSEETGTKLFAGNKRRGYDVVIAVLDAPLWRGQLGLGREVFLFLPCLDSPSRLEN